MPTNSLIAAGADVERKDADGCSALDWAVAKGHTDCADIIRSALPNNALAATTEMTTTSTTMAPTSSTTTATTTTTVTMDTPLSAADINELSSMAMQFEGEGKGDGDGGDGSDGNGETGGGGGDGVVDGFDEPGLAAKIENDVDVDIDNFDDVEEVDYDVDDIDLAPTTTTAVEAAALQRSHLLSVDAISALLADE
jgi:ankyrin repeat protein